MMAAKWVLGTKPPSSARALSALNDCQPPKGVCIFSVIDRILRNANQEGIVQFSVESVLTCDMSELGTHGGSTS